MSRLVTMQDLVSESIIDELRGEGSTVIEGVQHDSRRVRRGDLFVAVPGYKHDGAAFALQAAAQGASAIVAEQWLDVAAAVGRTRNARRSLALAAARVYGDPTSLLHVVGVTGTNGKTSVTQIVSAGLQACGAEVAHVGTLGMQITSSRPGQTSAQPAPIATQSRAGSSHTTPEADDLMRFARQACGQGCTHLVMEVSSHALALHRVDGVHFEVAAFTNLSQDHLDFHSSMQAYGEAKARLFESLHPRTSVINVDDDFGRSLAERLQHRGQSVRTVSVRPRAETSEIQADVQPINITHSLRGISGEIVVGDATMRLQSGLVGEHNVQNLLVALGCLHALGVDLHRALRGIESFRGVPGRLERVSAASPENITSGVQVFVDYAHTPDALTKVLSALRPHTTGRLIAVFGAGGDRDPLKRPLMGRAAAMGADLVMLTDDNPRTEDPAKIVEAIERGVREVLRERCEPSDLGAHARAYAAMHDRRQAIRHAIHGARSGDVVVIAGKGHENYQIVGTECLSLDDRDEARLALQERGLL